MHSQNTVTSERGTLAGQVFGLLAFAAALTAAGAIVAPRLGTAALNIGAIGALITFAIIFFGRRLPSLLRLGVFYLFSVFQGLTLGVVVGNYTAAGQGDVIALAAGTTAALVALLSLYAWTTKRNFAGWAGYLFVGLIGVLVAGVIGFFARAPLYHFVVAIATALVFSGYLVFKVQQLKAPRGDAVGLAIGIYIDILNIFYALLRIISELTRRR